MTDLRKDPVTGRWVIISTERQKRPSDFQIDTVTIEPDDRCPFCEGHEDSTPPEILAYRNGTPANRAGWEVRVVPNKFPALRVEGLLDREGEGLFDRMNGIGAHEVIIETPDHTQTLATMPASSIEKVFWAWRDRVLDLKRDVRLRQIVIFKNHGAAAGASIAHAHSQLIALPIIPRELGEELEGARRHYLQKERCVFCDLVRQEIKGGTRVIAESADFVAVAAYAPRSPFETWLLPKRHGAGFEEATPGELASLARMLKDTLRRMNATLLTPPFNIILHSAPLQENVREYYHWHLEVMPKLTRVAGFEWGTGFYINPTGPEEAAEVLRKARLGATGA
jgi:UDPglucose--hexose-1-phosphate uridylyltransferase